MGLTFDARELSVQNDDSTKEIRKRMAELRRELDIDMGKVSQSARAMTDWTFYVRRFPWAVAGAAAVAGYLLIPKKKQNISPDPEALSELVKNRQVRVEPASLRGETNKLLKSLLMTGIGLAARAAINYAAHNLQRHKAESADETRRPPAPSPLEEPWQK
jgi:hypothetical protein